MVQKYAVSCAKCSEILHVETIHAGNLLSCSACGDPIQVPQLRELRNLAPVLEESNRETSRTRPKLIWGPLAGFLFSFGLLLLAIGLGAGYYLWQQRQAYVNFSEAPEIEKFEFDVDLQTLSLTQSWSAWEGLKKAGDDLSNRAKPRFLRAREEIKKTDRFLYLFAGLATVGLIFSLAAFLFRTPL